MKLLDLLLRKAKSSTNLGTNLVSALAGLKMHNFPHFLSGGRLDLSMNDFAFLYVRVQRLNSVLYSPLGTALYATAQMPIG